MTVLHCDNSESDNLRERRGGEGGKEFSLPEDTDCPWRLNIKGRLCF